jgi:hypothetical protein
MKWDQQRPAKAAAERCRCQDWRPTAPPQEFSFLFSYTHRPGRSGPHGPAGSGVDFPIPQNSFVWVLLKMGSRARNHNTESARRLDAARPRAAPRKPATLPNRCFLRAGRCSACSLLIYPPTRAQWPARAGGLWCGFPNPAKLICIGSAKNGLASSQPRDAPGSAHSALPNGRAPIPGLPACPGAGVGAPRPAYPAPSQPAYPTPPSTLHLPDRLPCTRIHPTPSPVAYLPRPPPQTTYPAPTLHLPCTYPAPTLHLPCTRTHPAPPRAAYLPRPPSPT